MSLLPNPNGFAEMIGFFFGVCVLSVIMLGPYWGVFFISVWCAGGMCLLNDDEDNDE